MYLINRGAETLTFALFNSTDNSMEIAFNGPEWFWAGQVTSNLSLVDRTECKACIAYGKTRDFGRFRHSPTPIISGMNLKPGDTAIVKRISPAPAGATGIAKYEVINWTTIYNTHVSPATANAKNVNKLDQSAKIAAATMRSVAAGVSIIEPPGAKVISGILNIVALIVDTSTLPSTSTPPPDLIEIVNAVRSVVRDELNKQSAELAASQFVNVTTWLSGLKGTLLGPHSYDDFERDIEKYLAADSNFMNMLTHMARNPDESMNILPIYAVAVSTYVQMLWLHFAISIAGGDSRSKAMYQLYQGRVKTALDGLNAGLAAATKHVDDQLNSLHGKDMEPETGTLTKALWNNLCGVSGPDDIKAQLQELSVIVDKITADAGTVDAGGDQFLWKNNWTLQAQPALA